MTQIMVLTFQDLKRHSFDATLNSLKEATMVEVTSVCTDQCILVEGDLDDVKRLVGWHGSVYQRTPSDLRRCMSSLTANTMRCHKFTICDEKMADMVEERIEEGAEYLDLSELDQKPSHDPTERNFTRTNMWWTAHFFSNSRSCHKEFSEHLTASRAIRTAA